ncbi:MAG: WYL domain-containing protein, partial [Thiotrichales bacterium]|nr:WYL domain-containing protein [Thiotrichales bacterium]
DYQQQHSHRILSPQRLIYYRDNWYCDAWCHRRKALRTFSLARVKETQLLSTQAKELPNEQMDDYYSSGYGMFAGKTKHKATLRFFPAIAREIAKQQWHPQQYGEWDGNDYLLTLPYSDQRELVQDILRHSPNVIVESPARLKSAVKRQLHMALEVYDEI